MTIPAPLLAHYKTSTTTIAWGLKVTRTDSVVLALTSHDEDKTVDGTLYLSKPGLDISSLVSSAGFAVDNTEFTALADAALFTRPDVIAGLWDGASFELFQFNWSSPADGRNIIKVGTLGIAKPRRGAFAWEMRDLRQRLQGQHADVVQENCRYRLGDAKCAVDLAPYTFAAAVTTAGTRQTFTAAALTQAADYFGEGVLTWTDGANAGFAAKVSAFTTGVVTLSLPMTFDVGVGDTFSIVAGCRKRLMEDCKAKFSNVLNFGGEPHKPTPDKLVAPTQVQG